MSYKHGLRNGFFVGSVLHQANTTIAWSHLDLTESVGHEDSRDEAEIINRRGEYAVYGSGKRKASYTIGCTYDPSDAAQALVWAAYRAGTPIAIAVMDGNIATPGVKGTFMDAIILSASKPEDLAAFDSVEFTFKPAAESTYEPTFNTIAAPTTTT